MAGYEIRTVPASSQEAVCGAVGDDRGARGRGRAVFATRALRCGDTVLEDVPFLECEADDDLVAQWTRNTDAFAAASPEVRAKVLDLLPQGVDEGHRLARMAGAFAAERAQKGGCTADELRKVVLAFHLTSYQLEGDESKIGLFSLVSKFNHACCANARGALRPSGDGPSYVYALRDIEIGEEITMCYLPSTERLQHASARREHLHGHKMFWCDCAACAVGTDSLRLVPCPACHARSAAGLLSESIASTEEGVKFARQDLVTGVWSCGSCAGSWSSGGDFWAATRLPSGDEERLIRAVQGYMRELECDCFHDAPDFRAWRHLRAEVAAALGNMHSAALLLDLCMLDHSAIQLQERLFPESSAGSGDASVDAQLEAYRARATAVWCRISAALPGGSAEALPLLWQDLWNAGSLLSAFGWLEAALPLLSPLEPFLPACARFLLMACGSGAGGTPRGALTPEAGTAALAEQLSTESTTEGTPRGALTPEAGTAALAEQLRRCRAVASLPGPTGGSAAARAALEDEARRCPILVLFRSPQFEGDGLEWRGRAKQS